MKKKLMATYLATCFGVIAFCAPTYADVKVGVILSLSGPAASAGLLQQKALGLLASKIGSEPVKYILLDDATDTASAIKGARKLIVESKIDVLIAATTTPAALAVSGVANDSNVPQISLAPFGTQTLKWSFVTPPSFGIYAKAITADLVSRKIRKLAYIGYADGLGQSWLDALTAALSGTGITFEIVERYNRADTNIASQVLRIVAANPQAVIVGATSASAAEPQKALVERGFKGPIYHTQAAATKEFLRAVAGAGSSAILPVSLTIVAKFLPEDHPSKQRALAFVAKYEGVNGEGMRNNFASHLWDAGLLLEAAVPVALASHKPGTAEFRKALRDALESVRNYPVSNGVVSMSGVDHFGYDDRAAVLARIEKGQFVLAK